MHLSRDISRDVQTLKEVVLEMLETLDSIEDNCTRLDLAARKIARQYALRAPSPSTASCSDRDEVDECTKLTARKIMRQYAIRLPSPPAKRFVDQDEV
jgi:hypothetical protein